MQHARGFSLLEVLLATTLVTVGVAVLAQLFTLATRTNYSAKTTTLATVLAQQKMEQLRGLTWGFDAFGAPISDTTTDITVVPEAAFGGTGLSASPADVLLRNAAGYCDFVDRDANSLGGGTAPPAATAYIRRWSVQPLPDDPDHSLVFQVLVTRWRDRGAMDPGGMARLPDEAYMVSVKTRKAS
jgi:outer membrane receptor for monomeric catechols